MALPTPDSESVRRLLEQVQLGQREALDPLLAWAQSELRTFVQRHWDPRLGRRLDPSDLVQETQVEIVERLEEFLRRQPMPFGLWIRKQAYEQLQRCRRQHLCYQRRSLLRERSWPEESSLLVAGPLLGRSSSPSAQAMARERVRAVNQAVSRLEEEDREILLLRHGEEMSYGDIALLLDLTAAAARKRYGRALIRLQKLLKDEGLLE